MISEIRIQGVASYQSLVTLETDKKVNIIYGLNGTGKSTLSNYLYDPLSAGYESCSIDIGSDESILVYNQRFIQDHFFEADSLKGIFSLSKENKHVEEKIIDAEAELSIIENSLKAEQKVIEEEQSKISELKDKAHEKLFEIKRKYTGGDRVLEYCLDGLKRKEPLFNYVSNIPKPDNEPAKSIQQIKDEVEAINGETAKKYEYLSTFSFLEQKIEESDLFNKIIIGSADSSVSALIDELKNSDWVRQGLEYIPENIIDQPTSCPFCQKKTITKHLASEIKGYFDKTYDDSVNMISNYLERYINAADALLPLDSYKINSFVENYLSELTEKYRSLEKSLNCNINAISEKEKKPSIQVALVKTDVYVQEFNEIIALINNDISNHNDRLDNIDSEMNRLRKEFWELMRWEYDQTIAPYFVDQNSSKKIILDASERKLNASKNAQIKRNEIAELQKSTVNIEEAVSSINNSLVNLGITDFSIKRHCDELYRIVRDSNSDAIFSSLSEGEKMIISFLYFCEVCKGKRSAAEISKKKIAIIDDPVSSLSHIYVYNVGQLLKTEFFLSSLFEQVFILTHSLYFFYELADPNHNRRKENQKLFRLSKNSDGSNIKAMKYEEIQNDYHSYWTVVNDRNQPPALIANCMRNIIEYFFNFVQKADLSNVVQKPELQGNKFQSFCRYINRESHSLGQNIFGFKEFNYDDFREGLRLVFEVTGYPEHYEKMTKSIAT
ncbi:MULTISPECIES: AAA family ATPase [unclassified Halomonas]|uniref:AAA family ATPase n=1 Tax=unclassified Halomonas TaxID=2609666 RepID=UPI00209F0535|nr:MULTISPECIES: AAA family ATPase [unclassified Halomonas]MCP1313701.1 AAA family ATPase [Halomonas sp. 707D7]MCP1326444.1 AAA family ATPase [Halomonas sp. 707D4]